MGVKVREKPKGSGEWWVFINHLNVRKSKKVGRDQKIAEDVARKIEARLVLGDFNMSDEPERKAPDFTSFSALWLEDYVKPLRRQSTYNRYEGILRQHVNPVIGKMPIKEIKRKHIRNLVLGLKKQGYSRSMISLVRDVISGPMGYAVDEEVIEANPVTGILKRLNLSRDKIKIEPFNHEEVELFLTTCREHFKEHHAFFLCGFRTGMRLGELLALQWGDIDWNGKFIRVQRAYRRGRVSGTKTGRDRRVDMSDQLSVELRKHLTRAKREALESGRGEPHELVFHRDGAYIEQNHIRRVFKRILKKAGLRDMRPHDIRHTFASLLLSNGESPVYVKEQLGHSSIQITVDIYGHLIPSSNRNAVNRLDSPHLSAPHPHPEKQEGPQPVEIAALS